MSIEQRKLEMLSDLLNTVEKFLAQAKDLEPIVAGFRELLNQELNQRN